VTIADSFVQMDDDCRWRYTPESLSTESWSLFSSLERLNASVYDLV